LNEVDTVLGIETSCDETGVALYSGSRGLLAHALHSQVALHADYGGVVPELASRDHVRKLAPLVRSVLAEAGLEAGGIQGVAYTAGPGLVGALLTGAAVARSLAWSWQVPAVEIHHMEGHLLAPMLEAEPPAFPFVALLVSGGHTMLVQVDGVGRYISASAASRPSLSPLGSRPRKGFPERRWKSCAPISPAPSRMRWWIPW